MILVTRTLGRLGYQVTGQTDPVRAVEFFRSNSPGFDAVVTDVAMPKLSGFELSRANRRRFRPDIPIVMTSGFVRSEDHARSSAHGVAGLDRKARHHR